MKANKTTKSVYPVSPGNKEQHLMAVAKITADAFAGGQHVEEISKTYFDNCHYDWDTSFLAWDGKQLIHHWGVWGYPMRIESMQVKVAGVGAVFTREEYRKQGIMQSAALASFEAMRKNGYDLSILRGRHYANFGYVRAWNYVTYRLKPDEIPNFKIKQRYELLGPQHMDEIINLYNRKYSTFSGTAVRPTYRMLETGDMSAYGWFENGALVGYVRALPTDDKKTLQCLEATGAPKQGLAVLANLFQEGKYESLAFFTLPHRHPILQIIRRGACFVEEQYFYHTGWQVKIINLQNVLEKLTSLLEIRLQNSQFANWSGTLGLDAGDQQATLSIETGNLQITNETPQHHIQGGAAIGRFLIGSDEPEEIIQQEKIACTEQVSALAHVLFPNLRPMMSHWDEY